MTDTIIHLRTQNDQPYGSQRRCCDRCGTMIWPERFGAEVTPPWTDDPKKATCNGSEPA